MQHRMLTCSCALNAVHLLPQVSSVEIQAVQWYRQAAELVIHSGLQEAKVKALVPILVEHCC